MLLLAMALGALHALTPGHGKAMVAAYLIGSRGRVRDAVLLGGVVTATHTLGVFALGLALLLVSNFVMPRTLQPILELLSGLLVVALGGYLLWVRVRELRTRKRHHYLHATNGHYSHDHADTHLTGVEHKSPTLVEVGSLAQSASALVSRAVAVAERQETHSHTAPYDGHVQSNGHTHQNGHDHGHSHNGHNHTHSHSHLGKPLGKRTLIGLGISGGLVPCPDAIAILLFAGGLGQIALGLGLVAGFSLGLAGVLIAMGVVLVKMKGALDSRLPQSNISFARWIPVVSAVVVVLMGLLIMMSALES